VDDSVLVELEVNELDVSWEGVCDWDAVAVALAVAETVES